MHSLKITQPNPTLKKNNTTSEQSLKARNPFRDFVLRLSQKRHGRGFGVHSPLAYRLITDILADNPAYYADAQIKQLYSSRRQQRTARIILRLCAFFNPATAISDPFYHPTLKLARISLKTDEKTESSPDLRIDIVHDESKNKPSDGLTRIEIGQPGTNTGPLVLTNNSDIEIVIHRRGLSAVRINTSL